MSFKKAFKQRRRAVLFWLLPKVGYPLFWLLCATLRLRIIDSANVLPQWQKSVGVPHILVFWHDELFVMPWFYKKAGMARKALVIISQNLSGEVIASIAKKFGVDAARGSPSKGGKQACCELVEGLKKGELAAITPDGSRGPRHVLKTGVFFLARGAQANLVPMRIALSCHVCLPTWDRFQIPLPFSKVTVSILPPIEWNDAHLEEKLKNVMAAL